MLITMIKHKCGPITVYSSVILMYGISLKGLSEFGEDVTVESVDENIKKLASFSSYLYTTWNFVLQFIFLGIAIMDESSKLLNLDLTIQKSLSRVRAFIYNTLLFPSTLLVMTTFWCLWHIDRELIFPKAIDVLFPSWLNHTLHTFIIVPLIIELMLPKTYNFVQFRNAAIVLTVYHAVYQLLFTSVYWSDGVWLYPIYKILTWPQRITYPLAQLAVALVYLKIGIVLQNRKRTKLEMKIH